MSKKYIEIKRTGMKYLLFIVLLVAVLITAGCVNNQNTVISSTPTSEIKLSTIEPSEMALQLSDVPDGFKIIERSEMTNSDVSYFGIDNGWKKGYFVRFERVDTKDLD